MLLLLFNDYNSETKTDPAVQEPVKGSWELCWYWTSCMSSHCAQMNVVWFPLEIPARSVTRSGCWQLHGGEAKHRSSAHTAMPHSWFNISKVSLYIHYLLWRSAVMWWFTFTLWSVAYSSALASNYLCLFNLLLLPSQFDVLDISFKHRL